MTWDALIRTRSSSSMQTFCSSSPPARPSRMWGVLDPPLGRRIQIATGPVIAACETAPEARRGPQPLAAYLRAVVLPAAAPTVDHDSAWRIWGVPRCPSPSWALHKRGSTVEVVLLHPFQSANTPHKAARRAEAVSKPILGGNPMYFSLGSPLTVYFFGRLPWILKGGRLSLSRGTHALAYYLCTYVCV